MNYPGVDILDAVAVAVVVVAGVGNLEMKIRSYREDFLEVIKKHCKTLSGLYEGNKIWPRGERLMGIKKSFSWELRNLLPGFAPVEVPYPGCPPVPGRVGYICPCCGGCGTPPVVVPGFGGG